MPSMSENAGELKSFAPLYVHGYMVHPSDPVRREEWLAFTLGRLHREAAVGLEDWSSETVAALVRAACRGTGGDLDKSTVPGLMAGDVLLNVLQMQSEGVLHAGLDKACHLTGTFFGAVVAQDGTSYRASRESVTRHWRAFKNVAHYWAATSIVIANAERDGLDPAEALWDASTAWLGIAEALRRAALACPLPQTAGDTLLDDSAWALDGVEPAELLIPPLTQPQRDGLKGFQPRYR